MSNLFETALGGVAAICLLTAGGHACPQCVTMTCKVVGSSVELSGPAVSVIPDTASLVIDHGSAACELSVDPAMLTDSLGSSWSISLPYGGDCGQTIIDGLLRGLDGGAEVELGECGAP